MDYKKEYAKLEAYEPKEYFKPLAGRYELTILSEPTLTSYNEGKEITEQIELTVQHRDKVLTWTMAVGLSFKSLYGQLMALGNAKGKLIDEQFTLLVTGEDKNKTYVVLEALPYIQNKNAISQH